MTAVPAQALLNAQTEYRLIDDRTEVQSQSVPADSILLLTLQRTLQEPYLDLLESPERMAGGEVTSATKAMGVSTTPAWRRRICSTS
ncbi:MAG: hypothetical protein HND47_24475 [Chloroflexi bacterium]|nr:hypothetical protein [Chloroflexota bacterium]